MNKIVISLVSLIVSFNLYAAADIEAGKAKATTCVACHGVDGNSPVPNFPKIAGQGTEYLVKQINDFKEGRRTDPTMLPMVMALTPEDVENVAAFFSSQKQSGGQADPKMVELGQKLYRGGDAAKGISACIACHGPQGEGVALAKYPKISGQHATYTELQLNKFKNGERSNDESSMMRDIVGHLSVDDIKALSSYIQGLH